jgi:hypothetical protein
MARCFKFDWKCSKIEKILALITEPEKERIFEYMKSIYHSIKDSYKFFSGLSPSGNVTSIGTNLLSYIVLHCHNVVDNKNFKLSGLDLEFIACKANPPFRGKLNPDRQIIRY